MQPQRAPVKAVLFDLDDTLWPIAPTIIRAEGLQHDWLAIHAPALVARHSREDLRARRVDLAQTDPRYRYDLWSLRHTALVEALNSSGEEPAKAAELADAAMEVFSRERNVVNVFEDVVPGLALLGRHFALGTISNGFADLEAIGLAGHFRTSIAAHKLGFAKPDARIFHQACAALQVEPHEALYVGDDPLLDVEGAQKAGLRAVWMNRFDRTLPEAVTPDFHCTNLLELSDWLQTVEKAIAV
ncbi:MAG: HAD family hydrolase [Burkholderiaceae bacterium]|nr:HAD family hydrolase [Burkholderiaceae bacterium]